MIKELKLREAIERCLIVVPAPLTIQWQDEMMRFFGETFQIIHTGNDQQQLINLWQRESLVITSLDYAKQDDVRERIWQQRWDLVIIDEAHKCSAYTKRSAGRGDEVDKTKRYQLAEKLAAADNHLLLPTATPHHGDEDRFSHFIRLIDPDLFPEPHKLGEETVKLIRQDILRLGPDCPWALRRLKEDLRDMDGKRHRQGHFSAEFYQLPAPEFRVTEHATIAILYAPRQLRGMDRSDRVRACYQHAALQYVSGQVMTNASLRKRLGIDEKNYAMASRVIADAIAEGLIKPKDVQQFEEARQLRAILGLILCDRHVIERGRTKANCGNQ